MAFGAARVPVLVWARPVKPVAGFEFLVRINALAQEMTVKGFGLLSPERRLAGLMLKD